jgi:hypothetical protein
MKKKISKCLIQKVESFMIESFDLAHIRIFRAHNLLSKDSLYQCEIILSYKVQMLRYWLLAREFWIFNNEYF